MALDNVVIIFQFMCIFC